MNFFDVLLISFGLAADAFVAALVRGLDMRRVRVLPALSVAAVFGYLAGSAFAEYVGAWDNYVAALLLGIIGANMIKGSLGKKEENASKGAGSLFAMGFATSVDACAVGISFALNGNVRILPASAEIALTTFIISLAGVMLGSKLGEKYNRRAERAGGGLLIGMGLKMLFSA